eukprot:TRINITY_DN13377_c0_g1_i2.p1 TRINITY_DN13377_c0_g1~~TRINITY_DN13377_c0_g1_i2.p1  ORF type:complete len:412 (-),score=121.17 TRINITY_DN13377_c0_g1_i2:136-1371(-)
MAPMKAAMKAPAKKRPAKKAVMKAKKAAGAKSRSGARRSTAPKAAAALGPGGVCIAGESLIDMLPRKSASDEAVWRPCPGGAPFNALLAAKRLGMQTTYLASLSTDMFGEELYALLEKEGVDMSLVQRVDLPTTLAFVSRVPGQGEKYAFFKENAADRALKKAYVSKVLKTNRFDAVHMSLGAVTLEDKGMAAAFEELFRTAGKQGSLRTFDPNLRSNMVKGGAPAYKKLFEGFLRHVDVVKASDDDICFLYGVTEDKIGEIAEHWLRHSKSGPKLVVVTAGAKGATLYSKGGRTFSVAPPGTRPDTIGADGQPTPVKDTVGAGDTFMGALISGIFSSKGTYEWRGKDAPLLDQLLRNVPWTDASWKHLECVVERATVAAAINCARAGCDPPTSEETATAAKALGKNIFET